MLGKHKIYGLMLKMNQPRGTLNINDIESVMRDKKMRCNLFCFKTSGFVHLRKIA